MPSTDRNADFDGTKKISRFSRKSESSQSSPKSYDEEIHNQSTWRHRRSNRTDQPLSLDYMRLRNATESLIQFGGDLKMNDQELREAIKRAMFFECSSKKLIGMRGKQISMMNECLEIDNSACKQWLGLCRKVLDEKFGVNTNEIEKSLDRSIIGQRMSVPMDMTKPPPNFTQPPPHIPPFMTPPFTMQTTSFSSSGGHLASQSQSAQNLMNLVTKMPPSMDFSSQNSKFGSPSMIHNSHRSENSSRFGKFRDRESWRSTPVPPPGLIGINVKGLRLGHPPFKRSPRKGGRPL